MWYLLFLCIIPISSINSLEYDNVYRTYTSGKTLEPQRFYNMFSPVLGDTIYFRVKGAKDVYVALTSEPADSNTMFEIMIGAYENTYSIIRKNKDTNTDVKISNTPLNVSAYCGFWIQLEYWDGLYTLNYNGWKKRKNWLKISVGYEGQITPFITSLEKDPININFFGIGSWNTEGSWRLQSNRIQTTPLLISQRKFIVSETSSPRIYPSYNHFLNARRKIRFKVKAKSNAWIVLSETKYTNLDVVEILIGGWDNTRSVIRKNHEHDVVSANISKILDTRGFWIELGRANNSHQLTTDLIRVGREKEDEPFMQWKDPQPLLVNYYSYATTRSSEKSIWTLQEYNEPPVYAGEKYVETINDKHFNYEQFFKVLNKVIRFKIRCASEAHIALTTTAFNSTSMYEISIREKLEASIQKNRNVIVAVNGVTFILDENEYHDFWIEINTYNNGSKLAPSVEISVGFNYRDKPFLHMTDPDGFEVNYYSIATVGETGSGHWILEDASVPVEDRVVKKIIDSTDDYYRHFPIYTNVIQFKVRTSSMASFALSTEPKYADNNIVVALGPSCNTISKDKKQHVRWDRKIINETEYRGLWIKFNNISVRNGTQAQLIRVGREDDVFPFLAWTNPNPYKINYLGVQLSSETYGSSPSKCILKTKAKVKQVLYDEDIYTQGDGQISFFPTTIKSTSNLARFKVQAATNVMLFLLSTNALTPPYIKIVLGVNNNTHSIIYRDGILFGTVETGFLWPTKFSEFSLRWDYLENYVLKVHLHHADEEKELLSWFDYHDIDINYFGLTTKTANGTWTIPVISTPWEKV